MNNEEFLAELVTELTSRGYPAKLDGRLVTFDLQPEIGQCRTYVIEWTASNWQVLLTEINFNSRNDDDYDEDQTIIGDYTTIQEIADSIDEHEGEY